MAHADAQRAYRASKNPYRLRGLTPAEHGTRSKYVGGCRCDPCVLANRNYQREYMWLWRQGVPMIDITDVT